MDKKEKTEKQFSNNDFKRIHVYISGRVQGVFFRKSTQKKAQRIGILGWVKNLEDGRVEAIFEGKKESIEKIINWAKRGPIFAKVQDFKIFEEDYQAKEKNFEIKRN